MLKQIMDSFGLTVDINSKIPGLSKVGHLPLHTVLEFYDGEKITISDELFTDNNFDVLGYINRIRKEAQGDATMEPLTAEELSKISEAAKEYWGVDINHVNIIPAKRDHITIVTESEFGRLELDRELMGIRFGYTDFRGGFLGLRRISETTEAQ